MTRSSFPPFILCIPSKPGASRRHSTLGARKQEASSAVALYVAAAMQRVPWFK
jgi:hypothetical protein